MRLLQRGRHGVDGGGIDVAEVAQRQQVPTQPGDRAQCVDELADAVPSLRLQPAEQGTVVALRLCHCRLGLAPDLLHLLVLVQHRLAGAGDLVQQRGQAVALGVVAPVVQVEQASRAVRQQLVALRGHVRSFDLAGQVEQVRDRAHQFGVAELRHERSAGRARCGEFVGTEGRLPYLHRVDAGGVVVLGAEQHHAPVVQARIPVREHRRLQAALHQVVDEQRGLAGLALVEDVHHVFTVRRTDRALVLHVLHGGVEGLVFAVLQVVAAREDDAVVLGQLDAGLHDGIQPGRLAGLRVVDQSAPRAFAVRQHLEQDQRAHARELDVRVVQRLRAVLDRFAVDARAGLRVVLHLQRQVAADGLDEQGVEDVQVRVAAADFHVLGRPRPFEIERGRQHDVALAARIEVVHLALGRKRPAEHPHVRVLQADLEGHQQAAVTDDQLQQPRVLVIAVQLAEVALECIIGQEGRRDVDRRHIVAIARLHQPVDAEHVGDRGGRLQAHVDVEAEQQQVADLHDVAPDGVVLGAYAQAANGLHAAVAELLQAARVQCFDERTQTRALLV